MRVNMKQNYKTNTNTHKLKLNNCLKIVLPNVLFETLLADGAGAGDDFSWDGVVVMAAVGCSHLPRLLVDDDGVLDDDVGDLLVPFVVLETLDKLKLA